MSVGYITHDEAVIKHFIEDHNFAELYLQTVREDGDVEEIAEVQAWYDEAKRRSYWDKLMENVKVAIQNGYNLQLILSRLNEATKIVKAAMA